jgi:hypothetical protein
MAQQIGGFVRGLKDTIQLEVQVSRPNILIAAIELYGYLRHKCKLTDEWKISLREGDLREAQIFTLTFSKFIKDLLTGDYKKIKKN